MMFARFALLTALASASHGSPAAADVIAGDVSTKASSSLSVQVEPTLSDGRVVVKIAAKNGGSAPVQFGAANVVLAGADGSRVAWRSLPSLIGDIHAAYGLERSVETAATPIGSTAANSAPARGFQPDVSNYTGASTVAQTEAINSGSRRSPKRKKVSAADKAKAEAEIAQLTGAIVQDRTLAPAQVAAGMLVSEKLKPGMVGKPMILTVTIGSDQHSFNFRAPAAQ